MQNKKESTARADILVEFLEVAFHSILYFRDIYPKTIFSIKKKYQTLIHMSANSEVNEYIVECLKTARELLNQNAVKQIALVIMTPNNHPLERYCFDLESSDGSEKDDYFIKTEEVFRQYLLKLFVVNVKELPKDVTFQIQIVTTDKCSVQLNENVHQSHFPWVEADVTKEEEKQLMILPIKTLETSLVVLNMYVEK